MRKILKRIATFVATSALVTAMCISALAADTYNVAGAEGLTGVNWDPSQNQMTDNGDATPVVATVVAMIGLACVVVSMKAKQENK
jgi:hypothetical protein